jgi:hypothetical protein
MPCHRDMEQEWFSLPHSSANGTQLVRYSPLRSRSKQNNPSSAPMTRRSGSTMAPDMAFFMNANVLSNNSLALNTCDDKTMKVSKIQSYFSHFLQCHVSICTAENHGKHRHHSHYDKNSAWSVVTSCPLNWCSRTQSVLSKAVTTEHHKDSS